jgi:hypothetical protein
MNKKKDNFLDSIENSMEFSKSNDKKPSMTVEIKNTNQEKKQASVYPLRLPNQLRYDLEDYIIKLERQEGRRIFMKDIINQAIDEFLKKDV